MNNRKNYKLAPVNTLKKYVGVHFTDKARTQRVNTHRSASSMWEESDGGNQALEMRTRSDQ